MHRRFQVKRRRTLGRAPRQKSVVQPTPSWADAGSYCGKVRRKPPSRRVDVNIACHRAKESAASLANRHRIDIYYVSYLLICFPVCEVACQSIPLYAKRDWPTYCATMRRALYAVRWSVHGCGFAMFEDRKTERLRCQFAKRTLPCPVNSAKYFFQGWRKKIESWDERRERTLGAQDLASHPHSAYVRWPGSVARYQATNFLRPSSKVVCGR